MQPTGVGSSSGFLVEVPSSLFKLFHYLCPQPIHSAAVHHSQSMDTRNLTGMDTSEQVSSPLYLAWNTRLGNAKDTSSQPRSLYRHRPSSSLRIPVEATLLPSSTSVVPRIQSVHRTMLLLDRSSISDNRGRSRIGSTIYMGYLHKTTLP